MPCTTILAGKKATADDSTYIAVSSKPNIVGMPFH